MKPLSFLGILGIGFFVMVIWTIYDIKRGDTETALLWLPLLFILMIWGLTELADRFPKSKFALWVKAVMEWMRGGL